MRAVHRRIDKLERALGVSDRKPFEHTIRFVDGEGRVSGSLLISVGRMEWIDREAPEESGQEA